MFWADKLAYEIVERKRDVYLTECGLGASGIPHVGNLGDGIRAYTVSLALRELGVKSDFQAFSDDRDGLRKIPFGFPSKLREYIGKPVSRIPDPFSCHESYGNHMSFLLVDALERCGVELKFISSDEAYSKGFFDSVISEILSNWKRCGEIIFEMTGQEKYLERLPFYTICEECGKIYTTRVLEFFEKEREVFYKCDDRFLGKDSNTGEEIEVFGCGHSGRTSVRNGKLAWKVEFAARWKAYDVIFEAYGKDILDSVKVNDKICEEILGQNPPIHTFYEMFVERGGRKISGSRGNIFTPQLWLSYASPESLRLLMLKRLSTTRVVDLEEIPKYSDEVDHLSEIYFGGVENLSEREEKHLRRLYEYVYFLNPPERKPIGVEYNLLINLARLLPEELSNREELIIEILQNSKRIPKELDEKSKKELLKRIEFTTTYTSQVKPSEKVKLELEDRERKALRELSEKLKLEREAEEIQSIIFEVAKKHGIKSVRFFQVLYTLILGIERGPRASTLIKTVGQGKVREVIRRVLDENCN
ncbi:MAG: lysine--tRNA ligase [Candidatus Methanofastidiosia archaeon]